MVHCYSFMQCIENITIISTNQNKITNDELSGVIQNNPQHLKKQYSNFPHQSLP